MSVRQNRSRQVKRAKKELKKLGQPMMASGGESSHYIQRSIERRDGGAVVPYSRKQIKKLIAAGEVNVRKAGKRKKEIYFKSGERIIVSKNFKIAITYKN